MKIAMIFAAGRGERLKPLTDTCPKALCMVHQAPLIEHHVARLSKAGFERIVINLGHLGGKIKQHLGNGARWNVEICYSPEPPGALETGGAIVNALALLGDKPFITVNADTYTDYPFEALQLPSQSLAHAILVAKPAYLPHADFGLNASLRLENDNRRYTFTGMACYSPSLFMHHLPGRFSITPLLRQLASQQQITGEVHQGHWIDIGTTARLALANQT